MIHVLSVNQVITCRIAAQEYTFEQFIEVEVADFDKEQIAEFATKWFTVKHNPDKAKIFTKELNNEDNKPICELAVTPILLTLLCLIFEETSEFPRNRSDLYHQGTDWLLKRWDNRRGIKRDLTYKKLSASRKKELLSQLAFKTFERGNYFFKQAAVEQHIIRYIHNLPGGNEEDEALQLDGEAVLKSIEAQHGLLVERAKGIYSFSHLTFQEYFMAQHIVSPTATLHQTLQNLATHITEKRYREVILLTAGMLPDADGLLLLMKQNIDHLLVADSFFMVNDSPIDHKLQAVLAWVQEKAVSADAPYKPAAIRAFYFSRVLGIELDRDLALGLGLDSDFSSDLYLDSAPTDFGLEDFVLEYDYDLDSARKIIYNISLALTLELDLIEQAFVCDPKLKLNIQSLREELPNQNHLEEFILWWWNQKNFWDRRLQKLRIQYHYYYVGLHWRFGDEQEEALRQYYDANKLLVDCLNSDCYVTKATRQYIEDTLMLPLSEIEKYPVPDAIANL